jgi:hypothetical protein
VYKIAILLLTIIHCYNGMAQSMSNNEKTPSSALSTKLNTLASSPDVFFLPAHTFLKNMTWRDSIFLFSSFQYGRITFATGYSQEGKVLLNYDLYMSQMNAITKGGDTTQIKRTKELRLISIGDHLFLQDYKVGYIEIIQQLPVSLGVLNVMSTIHMQYVSGNRDGTIYGTDVRGTPSVYDRYYRKEKEYYFVGKENKVYKATRASILKLFRGNKHVIDVYLRENQINFEERSDLTKLLQFCHQQEGQASN